MIRKKTQSHTADQPKHREEEPQNTNSNTTCKVKQPAFSTQSR